MSARTPDSNTCAHACGRSCLLRNRPASHETDAAAGRPTAGEECRRRRSMTEINANDDVARVARQPQERRHVQVAVLFESHLSNVADVFR